jgi:cystathionine gamma-synthase/cystathionine beta-lyase
MTTPLALETQLAQAGCRRDPRTGALSVPIYQTASFAHPALGQSTGFDYSRTSNPTRLALEEALAAAEGGHRGFAFASGLAAIDTVLRLLDAGSRVVVTEDLYGGTFRLFEKAARSFGIEALYVDTSCTEAVGRALKEPGVRALFIESPTNPLLKIANLPVLIALARGVGAVTIVDNTFMTPCRQRPIDLGAELVVYSATKYLAGHNDVVAGAVVARTSDWSERIAFLQNAVGAVLGPQDSWLTLRGLKTLPLRLKQQEENAGRIAEWLSRQPRVKRVYYPGLPGHPGHDTLKSQASGFGAMIAFEVEDAARVPAILEGVRVFLFAESLGGVESLITYPRVQTHADMAPAVLDRLGIGHGLLRLSVGIENVADLIRDLENVL